MDAEILQGFIDEAESYFPTVRGGILLCTQEEKSKSELEASIKQVHTIKGAAAMLGLSEISEHAKTLEEMLKSFVDSDETLADKDSNAALDKLSELEAKVSELRFGMDEFEFDASNLVEESFEGFQSEDEPETEMIGGGEEEDSFEDFEIDDEMLEIFAMEAEDHLKNINENLVVLEKTPNDREALLEIRRSSHTLKGSAGIVGLKTLSTLAHKVEDLLDYISDNDIESNEEIFELLLSATDCISAVTNNESSQELTDKIDRTQNRLDGLLESIQTGKQPEEKKEEVTKIKKVEVLEPVKPEITKEPAIHPNAASNTRSVIRVSLEKLDDLVKLVGEMVFSRSVFEQRLSELELQIDELQNTTRRLRHSTGKLETGFESEMPGTMTFGYSNLAKTTSVPGLFAAEVVESESKGLEFDSLEFDRYTEFNQTTRELIETTNDTLSINGELDTVHSFLEMLFDSQKRLIDEMQDKLLSLRMVSFGSLSARLQRTVRVTAEEEQKLVDLSIEGENLEVDTQILDSLVDPLLHLLRNAVAHGIEPPETRRLLGKDERGKISLKAYSEGTHIILSVKDDGRGISATALKEKAIKSKMITKNAGKEMSEEEALDMIFLPGLTTAEEISQISGRGVGMNIVKTSIEKQKGTIAIDSELQKGTTFNLRLPMALAVTRCLLVEANGEKFTFPLKLVKHISEIAPKNLEKAKKEKKLRLGDVTYTVSHLNELLGMPVENTAANSDVPLLLIETIKKPCALVVDRIIKPQEVVIKPLGNPLKDVRSMMGATLLGDGSVVPVLDLVYLLDEQKPFKRKVDPPTATKVRERLNVLIVDDSPSVRHVNSTLVKNNHWEPIVAKDGVEALELLKGSTRLPDIILTDVEMPEMDGYELLASLKQDEMLKEIPVIMITSRAGDKHRRKAFDLGVSDYLTKPYEEAKLIEMIKSLNE